MPPFANQASEIGDPTSLGRRVWCANEDVNRNGSVDSDKDKNNDGRLQPEAATISFAYVGDSTKPTPTDNWSYKFRGAKIMRRGSPIRCAQRLIRLARREVRSGDS